MTSSLENARATHAAATPSRPDRPLLRLRETAPISPSHASDDAARRSGAAPEAKREETLSRLQALQPPRLTDGPEPASADAPSPAVLALFR